MEDGLVRKPEGVSIYVSRVCSWTSSTD